MISVSSVWNIARKRQTIRKDGTQSYWSPFVSHIAGLRWTGPLAQGLVRRKFTEGGSQGCRARASIFVGCTSLGESILSRWRHSRGNVATSSKWVHSILFTNFSIRNSCKWMVQGQLTEVRGQRSEVRGKGTEDRGQKSAIRNQKTEARRWKFFY